MLDKIKAYAKHKGIKLVTMNGSRVNHKIISDPYQDYDVVFFVEDIDSFVYEPEYFGEVLIYQNNRYGDDKIMMTQYTSGLRIDLQIRNISGPDRYLKEDSLTHVIYNETDRQINIIPNDTMHRLLNPTAESFKNSVNEIYWVSLYVVKALRRNQINYATYLMTTIILEELSLMLGYNINIKHDKEINYGLNYKYLGHYLEEGAEYYYSLYTRPVSYEVVLEVLDWYQVLVENVALVYGFEMPKYHNRIVAYIKQVMG